MPIPHKNYAQFPPTRHPCETMSYKWSGCEQFLEKIFCSRRRNPNLVYRACCKDIFSKKPRVVPMKTEDADTVCDGIMEHLYKDGQPLMMLNWHN